MKIIKTLTLILVAIMLSMSGAAYANRVCIDKIIKAQTGFNDYYAKYANSAGAFVLLDDESGDYYVELNAGVFGNNETSVSCSKNANGTYNVSVEANDGSITGSFVITTSKPGVANGTITDANGGVYHGPFNPQPLARATQHLPGKTLGG